MAIQKKGLLIGGVILLLLAIGGVGIAIVPDLLHQNDDNTAEHAPSSYQSLMTQYYTAIVKNDPNSMYQLMAPTIYWDYYMEHYEKTQEDIIAIYQQAIADTMADWRLQCGTDVSVSFSITGMSEQSEDFLTEWTEDMNEMLGEDAVHAEQAITLQVERTLEGNSKTMTEVLTPTIIEIDGLWYILDEGDVQETEAVK